MIIKAIREKKESPPSRGNRWMDEVHGMEEGLDAMDDDHLAFLLESMDFRKCQLEMDHSQSGVNHSYMNHWIPWLQ